MVRVLFIVPKQSEEYPEYPHTGIGYLSEYLKKNNVENKVIDMRLGYNNKEIARIIEKNAPEIIAVSMVTANRNKAYFLVDYLKGKFKDVKIVIGGPHISMMKSLALKECRADFAIKGEGEEAMLDLARRIRPEKIANLIFRNKNKIIENLSRDFIKNLDKVPWPKYQGFDLKKYVGGGRSIVTSRGCPYSCIYCSAHLGSGKLFRARSPENILEEIKILE